ncbi:hypothetical protein LY90DRAFT_676120 [Neocallimastix californiae]|uniref:Right handed beta helix domain-containing protein n=1 Tax=Neocallimastix californiae TaxID=1754190 RepID=A0A1Y2AIL5_9FUNG|nr:hypothetical protein LY90DRAFT_676120 [Neocallimastix californiae]|eukprot:ORY21775.1 hypothetical protein LY90DRAFT_676120 [Neocallimastix californiae]
MTLVHFTIDIPVQSNISFIGNKNGTVFDYKHDKRGRLIFNYSTNKGETVKMENIIFENFNSFGITFTEILLVFATSDNFYFIINNCTFRNNENRIFRSEITCEERSHSEPSIVFNNCNFYNNTQGIIGVSNESSIFDDNRDECSTIDIKNSIFINNAAIIYSHHSHVEIDNCYFSRIENYSLNNKNIVFYSSRNIFSNLIIKNSIFKYINTQCSLPLIDGENIKLEIFNTSFSNCYTSYGYLIDIRHTKNLCTLFHGDDNIYEIDNSYFYDIKLSNSIPILSDSRFSIFTITNTKFSNITSLFGEQSQYTIKNVQLNSIYINSKAILYFIYNNVVIDNLEVEDIKCVGDDDKSSFLLFDSGEDKKSLNINKLSIKNGVSNGGFIKINGYSNKLVISNSFINNIKSSGSIIESKSKNVKINTNNNTNNIKLL